MHGLGGSAESAEVRRMARAVHQAGWCSLRLCLRGADPAGEDFYHAGICSDLSSVLEAPELRAFRRVSVIGFSVGGHVCLKLAATKLPDRVRAVVSVSAPLDLAESARYFDDCMPLVYRRHVFGSLQALLPVVGVLSCSQAAPTSPEQAVCESLSGQVTPLRIPLSTDPVVDGKLRAFVAAVRALEDTAIQAEMITAEACTRIALELGGQATLGAPSVVGATTPTPETASAEAACSAALSRIQEVAGKDPVPITVSPPTCTTDFVRLGRCEATCAVQGPEPACEQLCQAEAAAYGLCRAARIAMPDFSGMSERWVLARSVRRGARGSRPRAAIPSVTACSTKSAIPLPTSACQSATRRPMRCSITW